VALGFLSHQAFLAKPPSAQWNLSTSVLEWRLNELSPGQKQLFEAVITLSDPSIDPATVTLPPQVPVIFKCQSLDTTLSRVDATVSGEGLDVTQRVQKRFRVSYKAD
jgi:hypothetical protein